MNFILHLELFFQNKLGLTDGFVGASAFAGAAIDAFVSVDGVGSVAGRNGAHRANIGAGAASYTKVGIDFSRHSVLSLNCCCFLNCEYRHYI